MGLTTSEMSAADIAAVTSGANGFGNGDGAWWIIILFLFAAMGGNWGNNGNNGSCGSGYVVQQGFDQAAVMGGINGLTAAISGGFGNAEVSRCNAQANILQTLNSNQNATTAAMSDLAMSLQNCCCENRASVADLKYTVATEACNDRAAINDALREVITNQNEGTQRILDQMCQDKIDAKNERIADLERQLTMANLAASQGAQTAQILADNAAQTMALEQYLNPVPVPAYTVPAPYTYMSNTGCGCGSCGSF